MRRALVKRIFCLAEQLTGDHGFLLLVDPIVPRFQYEMQSLDDPVLDLVTRNQAKLRSEFLPGEVRTEILPQDKKVWDEAAEGDRGLQSPANETPLVTTEQQSRSITATWQLARASLAICRKELGLRLTAHDAASQGTFEPVRAPQNLREATLCALRKLFELRFGQLGRLQAARLAHSLDCLAIYTLPHYPLGTKGIVEPRIPRNDDYVQRAIKDLVQFRGEEASLEPPVTLLEHYFLTDGESLLLHRFRQDYEEILYPAWRYCARYWRAGISATSLAGTCLEFGSTSLRPEFITGLHQLVTHNLEKVGQGLCQPWWMYPMHVSTPTRPDVVEAFDHWKPAVRAVDIQASGREPVLHPG